MSKRELIDAILKHNRTAAPEFLAKFTENDLKAYLERMAIITIIPRREDRIPPPSRIPATIDNRQTLVLV